MLEPLWVPGRYLEAAVMLAELVQQGRISAGRDRVASPGRWRPWTQSMSASVAGPCDRPLQGSCALGARG